MKLDSNSAWKEASRNVSRNRDALLAVAGVFFLLPQLALALFFPQPEPGAGMSEQQIVQLARDYYLSTLPALIPLLVCQALGTLSLLGLLNHPGRPTVGQALRLGVSGLATYFGAQLLLGLGMVILGTLLISLAALSGVVALAVAIMFAVILVFIALAVRVSLSGAVVAVEGERNPVRALRRSWALTSGNGWRLFGFYALLAIAFMVILMIVSLLVGIPLQLVASDFVVNLVAAIVSSAMNALLALYLVAVIGAVHAQLAGRAAQNERRSPE